jgi:predicted lipoprotein with Yx(FWY)xxD motif
MTTRREYGRWPSAWVGAGLLTVAVVLVGCSSSSKSSSVVAGQSSSGGSGAATVDVRSTSMGQVLVDSAGKPLYTDANDQPGATTSACTGGCASAWPALMTSGTPTAGPGITGTLGKLASGQVTWNRHPLYTFASDTAGGNPTGDGVSSFHLALAGGSASTSTTKASSGYRY